MSSNVRRDTAQQHACCVSFPKNIVTLYDPAPLYPVTPPHAHTHRYSYSWLVLNMCTQTARRTHLFRHAGFGEVIRKAS